MRIAARHRAAAAIAAAIAVAALVAGGVTAALSRPAAASPRPAGKHPPAAGHHHRGPGLSRFDLSGYVIDAHYTAGRNTGNTFQQTYADSTVQGVPIAGPDVGTTFPREDYVAIPIGNHELYVTWLDPGSDAIVDVFVMNFVTHAVYDYAPGSSAPESAGVITVIRRGARRLP